MSVFTTFDAWETLLKSLPKQEKVAKVAELLKDKTSEDITFTSVSPDGSTQKLVLGSFEGNVAFLLGRANPGFHVASYHYMIVDPSLSEEEAEALYEVKGHPSLPAFWEAFGLSPFAEGDLEEGIPHPEAFVEEATDETFPFSFNGTMWVADPENQLIYNDKDHYFAWSLVKNTFLGSQNPEVAEKMLPFEPDDLVVHKSNYSNAIGFLSRDCMGREWEADVYPLVKSIFPRPGSILQLSGDHGESVFAVCTDWSVELFQKSGERASLETWGLDRQSIDLREGVGAPSVIIGFAEQYLNLDVDSITQYA